MKKLTFFALFLFLSKVIGHLFCNFALDFGQTCPECKKNEYYKNFVGSKKSKAYLSPKTAARHLRRLLKRRRKLEATDRLLCQTIEQLKRRLQYLEAKVDEHGD